VAWPKKIFDFDYGKGEKSPARMEAHNVPPEGQGEDPNEPPALTLVSFQVWIPSETADQLKQAEVSKRLQKLMVVMALLNPASRFVLEKVLTLPTRTEALNNARYLWYKQETGQQLIERFMGIGTDPEKARRMLVEEALHDIVSAKADDLLKGKG